MPPEETNLQGATLAKKVESVEGFLSAMAHSRREEVLAVRAIALSADPAITEHIKWNAPSFCYDTEDRVTMRLQPGNRVQLIFHCGVSKREDGVQVVVEDPSGLLDWITEDRAMVDFANIEDVRAKEAALQRLVRAWMLATRDPAGA